MLPKNMEHAPLECCPGIPEPKGHSHISIHSKRCDKRSHKLVGLFHLYLVVAGISIKERKDLTSCSRVYDLINAW